MSFENAWPPVVVTLIGPVVAAPGTVKLRPVDVTPVNGPATPLIFTEVTFTKPVPVRCTTCPVSPWATLSALIVGFRPKLDALVAFPVTVPRTVIFPVELPFGTTAVSCVGETTFTDGDAIPLNLTTGVAPPPMKQGLPIVEHAHKKFFPLTVTVSPATVLPGAKLEIVGGPFW